MKFGCLTIHNIASIADATIDFAGGALAGESLFLISGETGAGKSTILDCICLALYGTTPRMKRSAQGKYNMNTDRETTIGDPRQLLRRGMGEGEVKFGFKGSDGNDYTARWSIHRARKKADGRMSAAEWTLECTDTHTTLRGREVASFIEQTAVGLNFAQFCRTVMLAQGQFDQFLTAAEKDKSDILEKLTDTAQYSGIGQRIFEAWQQSNQSLLTAKAAMGGIDLMTPEQREAVEGEIARTRVELEQISGLNHTLSTQLQWLDTQANLQGRIGRVRKQLEAAEATLANPHTQAMQATAEQWSMTAEARTWLATEAQAKRDCEAEEKSRRQLEQAHLRLQGGNAWLQGQLKTVRDEMNQTRLTLETMQPQSHIYRQCDLIVAQLRTAQRWTMALKEDDTRRRQLQVSLPQASQALSDAQTRLKQLEGEQQDLTTRLQRCNNELQRLNPKQIESQLSDIHARLLSLNQALSDLRLQEQSRENLEQATTQLEAAHKQLQQANSLLQPDEAALHRAQEARERVKADYDKTSLSMDKWARAVRASLMQGDVCPVCGHAIDETLSDSHFEDILTPLKQSLNQADEQVQRCAVALQAHKKECEHLATLEHQRAADHDKRVLEYNQARQQLQASLEQCQCNATDNHKSWLVAQIKTCQEAINALTVTQNLITDKRQQIKQLHDHQDQLLKALKKAQNAHQKAEMKLAELNNQLDKAEAIIGEHTSLLKQACEAVNEHWHSDRWKNAWQADAERFVSQLEADAQTYEQLQQRQESLAVLLQQGEQTLQRIAAVKVPDFALTTAGVKSREVADLEGAWSKFNRDCAAWHERMNSARKTASEMRRLIEHFLGEHPSVDNDRLTALAQISRDEIGQMEQKVKEALSARDAARGAMHTLNDQLSAHNANRPSGMDDEPDRNALETRLHAMESQIDRLRHAQGALTQQLSDDDAARKRLGTLQRQVQEAQTLCDHWSFLNDHLGTSGGKRFQTVAQSFILGDLLHKANHFMRQFNDRYTLACQHDSLTILLEDSLTGTLSSVNTFSGGEGFMAALALALALSQMNAGHASVDTIFIDEGFGSLSPNYLERVMYTLRSLREHGGRRVGIISHVETLRESIATHIHVQRGQGGALSTVNITSH